MLRFQTIVVNVHLLPLHLCHVVLSSHQDVLVDLLLQTLPEIGTNSTLQKLKIKTIQ